MKTLIIALNSKYVHSSLAPWYLKAFCGNECGEIKIIESTVNDSLDSILNLIYCEKADNVAFSCYIWNIEYVLKLARSLKKISSSTKIILGGPEVSFDSEQILEGNVWVDYILTREGEVSFKLLLRHLAGFPVGLKDINGLAYREDKRIVCNNPCSLIQDLDSIPSPYTDEMLDSLENKIVYYESSRGCPFSCSYCISSTFEGVRYFSMQRVETDIKRLMGSCARQIKFVDRTFNCSKARAKEVFKLIISHPSGKNFHFEAAADLFDDEMLEILKKAPEGLIQFEIGIQTTNLQTLDAIGRKTHLDKVFHNVKRLRKLGNIHLHLDLIAGLPHEDFQSFKCSFNEVYSLKPHQLQLGFLKLLKGSRVREEASLYNYSYREYPPYEVLKNSFITYDEMVELKGIEEMVERYYNSSRFSNTLCYTIENLYSTPFEFYYDFYRYNKTEGFLDRPVSSRELYNIFIRYAKQAFDSHSLIIINELLKYDFLLTDNSANLPVGLERYINESFKDRSFSFLRNEANIDNYLSNYKGIPAKQIYKNVHFEEFHIDITSPGKTLHGRQSVVLFDYSDRNKVSGLFRSIKLEREVFYK